MLSINSIITVLVSLAAIDLLTACSNSSGVVKIGQDTYTISTAASPGRGGVPAAKKIAYEEAAAECTRLGNLELLMLSEKTSSPSWTEGMANMELYFRCLKPNDPEFQRQQIQQAPDKILEIRQK